MLLWAFGVLYVELAFCLPCLSLSYVLFLFRPVWEFTVVVSVGGVGVGDCQNDSIVGWFDSYGVTLRCCWSIRYIAVALSFHSSETASSSVFGYLF